MFLTRELVRWTPTCRHIHSLILRLIHIRLQIAAGLDGHTLFLECHHPSARLTAAKLYCTSLGTDGLQELLNDITRDDGRYIGQIERAGKLYSRFRPQNSETIKYTRRHPAGDIPGSRTHPDSNPQSMVSEPNEHNLVRETVTVDAHDLFSQLSTLTYLGREELSRGFLFSLTEVCEGTIRVWRDWLKKQCESRSFSDESTIVVHHDAPRSLPTHNGKARSDSVVNTSNQTKDPNVLWINSGNENVGIKFRVKKQRARANNMPLLYSSDVEVAVSYIVEYEGKTCIIAFLLAQRIANGSGRGACQDHASIAQDRRGAEPASERHWQGHCLRLVSRAPD